MKRRILTLVLLLVVAAFAAEANPVDLRTAREVAVKFMNANSEVPLRGTDDLRLVKTYNISRGDAAFYVFNTPDGFVIVSANDCATPILGYSNESQFDVEDIPIQLQDCLQDFVEQIQYAMENHLEADEQTAYLWEMVKTTGHLTDLRTNDVVQPLLTTKWSQYHPYNLYVPDDCPTGCVATAMAQIMKYWEWPVQGMGEHSYELGGQTYSANFGETTYDWDNMLDIYNSQATQEQREAVAMLMWHCGVSVDMMYGEYGSGAYDTDVPHALVSYFSYSNERALARRSDYSDASWKAKLKDCLNLGRPVYYSGSTMRSGHAFVCDGYDNNEMFHFNWGWGGTSDGYYVINAIGGYNNNNRAIFNIHPQGETTNYVINVSVNNIEGGSASGGGSFSHGTSVTLLAVPNSGYCFCYWEENGGIASTNPNYSFTANFNRNLVAIFDEPSTITVSALEGGTVSGGGTYDYGETCMLTAMPNDGYSFAYWTENDNVVSYDPNYSFVVTGERVLTAHFVLLEGTIVFADASVKAICVNNWDTNGDGVLSYAEAASVTSLGEVFRGNMEITSFDELQYFNNLTSIDDNAFYNCKNLTSIIFPNTLTSIGSSAFFNCKGLVGSINLPNTVTSIGTNSFRNCSGFSGLLTLPSAITSISDNAFYGCSGFTSLTISNSVTLIGNSAFYGCSGLTGSLTLPNSVTSVGSSAFYGCTGLIGMTIPNTVVSIGNYAFADCRKLISAVVLAEIPPTVGSNIFGSNTTNLQVYIPCGSLEVYQASQGWSSLSNIVGMCSTGAITITVNIDEGGEVEGAGIYEGGSLCTVSAIPNEGYSFAYWTENDKVVSFDANYSFIVTGESLFTAYFVPEGNIVFADANVKAICVANWDANGDGELSYVEAALVTNLRSEFSGNAEITSFEELQYFSNLLSIGSRAFYNCSGLTGSLKLPNSITSIGTYAFYRCSGLTGDLTIPNSVTSIGEYAFYVCSGFNGNLTLSNSVKSIGNYAFSNCRNLTGSLTIPNSVITIGECAFYYCNSLNGTLTIPNSVTSIGRSAFSGCGSLTGPLTIPDSITTIEYGVFSSCSGLTGSLIIPNTVTSIGEWAFQGCSSLTGTLTISNSVDSIGDYAFMYCSRLTSMVVLRETPPAIGTDVFYNVSTFIPVFVPCGSVEAYHATDGWSSFTNYHEDCMQALTITLSSGANWFSTNVDITLADLKAALVAAAPGTAITIQSQTLNTSYNPNNGRWTGQLTTLDVTRMYVITVTTDCEMVLNGMPVNPAEHPVTIASGANWIAYPLGQGMTLTEAFAGFAVQGDVVQSQTNNAQYIRNNWMGQLTELVPGKGYIYNSAATESRVFYFPIGAK